MRISSRQLALWLLVTSTSVVLAGGNAWHVGGCSEHSHSSHSHCSHSENTTQGSFRFRHDHHACHHYHDKTSDDRESDEKQKPLAPIHDHDSCVICKWVSFCKSPVQSETVLQDVVELTEAVILTTSTAIPMLLTGDCPPRGPPVVV